MENENINPQEKLKFEHKPPQRNNAMGKLKTIRDTFMGLMYILVAIALVWAEKTGYTTFGLKFTYALAAVFSVYGLFRLYRALILKK
ncbi:MAG TPA: hypothetical protein PKX92_13125 [Edaphocola sp.]|nr:hypothetical protein [Edaphocola sp.]